jgi:hypothetical protein
MIEFLNNQPIPGVELNIVHLSMLIVLIIMLYFTFKNKHR